MEVPPVLDAVVLLNHWYTKLGPVDVKSIVAAAPLQKVWLTGCTVIDGLVFETNKDAALE